MGTTHTPPPLREWEPTPWDTPEPWATPEPWNPEPWDFSAVPWEPFKLDDINTVKEWEKHEPN